MTGRTFGLLLKSCLLQFILLATAHLSAGAQNAIPRPEHPQPQLERKDWLNLNGPWQFEIDPGNSGEERGLNLDAPYSRTIRVPFCPESSLSGVAYKDFMLAVWYRRSGSFSMHFIATVSRSRGTRRSRFRGGLGSLVRIWARRL